MADNTTQVSDQINSAVNNALGVGALAAIYTGNFVSIGKVGGVTLALIAKTITENGVYNASDDGADGYNVVTVDVNGVEILIGDDNPTEDIGEDGQLYLKKESSPVNWTCDANYYVASKDQRIATHSETFYKINDGPAIAVHYHYGSYYGPLVISTVREYAAITDNPASYSANIDGVTWYMCTTDSWGTTTDSPTVPTLYNLGLEVNSGNVSAIISAILEAANMQYVEDAYIVNSAFVKNSNGWRNLIGADINDINLGGE